MQPFELEIMSWTTSDVHPAILQTAPTNEFAPNPTDIPTSTTPTAPTNEPAPNHNI